MCGHDSYSYEGCGCGSSCGVRYASPSWTPRALDGDGNEHGTPGAVDGH